MRTRLMVLLALAALLVPVVIWQWTKVVDAARRQAAEGTPGRGARPVAIGPLRPNVLLISLDTVRPDHLGCYGYRADKPTSPNLDRFSRGAAVFTEARAQAPWTLPSHMSLFTSMLPSSNRVDSEFLTLARSVPILTELLKGAGYTNVGVSHNVELASTSGFGRGFDTYLEFDPRTPEGGGANITDVALRWLGTAPREPWFLFVHYFDAHDPYDSPEPIRQRFGALSRDEGKRLLDDHSTPDRPFERPEELDRLIASYDAALAALDVHVGRLLDRAPPNTMVVIFSDHGEAFKEHGWLWHTSTLYEELIRAALIIREPLPEGGRGSGRVIDEPAMLLDVAPTILAAAGIDIPPTFEGSSLLPVLAGGQLPSRLIASETKAFRTGQLSKALLLPPWKLIYHMYDGRMELYKLPDEQTNLIDVERPMAEALVPSMRRWVAQEDFWLCYFTGDGEYEVTVEAASGLIPTAIPIGIVGAGRQKFDLVGAQGKYVKWSASPAERLQAVYLEPLPSESTLRLSLSINGRTAPDQVSLGRSGIQPTILPVELAIGARAGSGPAGTALGSPIELGVNELLPPFMEEAFEPPSPGLYLRRFSSGSRQSGPAPAMRPLEAERIEQLKALGYLQ